MTSNEPSETKRNVYDICDPHYLRQLREAAGIDHVVLARTACLSVAQVRQLETHESDSLFYSEAIKRQAYKRLLMILGAEPPTVELPQELRDAGKVADAHLNTLDQIVAMSHQPSISRSSADVVGAGLVKLKENKQVVGALLLLVVAIALFVWNGSHSHDDAAIVPSVSSAVEPGQTAPAVAFKASTVASSAAAAAITNAASLPLALPTESVPVQASSVNMAASAPTSSPMVVTAPAIAASSAIAAKVGTCAYSGEAMPEMTSMFAQKEGRYVYFVSTANIEICVVDGNKQATLLQLKAGENRSVYGVSPWQLSGAGLQKAQIYFQGGRLTLPDAATTRFKLIEVPVAR